MENIASPKMEVDRIDVRVSTLPVRYGENAVCRILDSTKSIPTVFQISDSCGLQQDVRSIKALKKKNGTLLVTWSDRIRKNDDPLLDDDDPQYSRSKRSSPSKIRSNTNSPASSRVKSMKKRIISYCDRSQSPYASGS
jgi:hypothetical protein